MLYPKDKGRKKTMIDKTERRREIIEQHEPHKKRGVKFDAPELQVAPTPL